MDRNIKRQNYVAQWNKASLVANTVHIITFQVSVLNSTQCLRCRKWQRYNVNVMSGSLGCARERDSHGTGIPMRMRIKTGMKTLRDWKCLICRGFSEYFHKHISVKLLCYTHSHSAVSAHCDWFTYLTLQASCLSVWSSGTILQLVAPCPIPSNLTIKT